MMKEEGIDKIKIVFILGTLDIGGTERQFLEIIRRLDRKRFELRVLAFPYHGKIREDIELLGIPLTCLGISFSKGRFHPESYGQLHKLICTLHRYFHREKPHIIQSYLFRANIFSCITAKIAGVPIIITGRRELMTERYKKFPARWLLNLTNRWATIILANSQAAKQECLRQGKYATDEKIHVIYNGINLDRYSFDSDEKITKMTLKIPDTSQVVGIVANLRLCKGHQDFLKAAALVLQKYPQTVFLLIGEDRGIQPILESLAEELGIRNSILFTGGRPDIPELLSILDIQVSASLTESLSNAILEGMAAGKPIIATGVGGNSELVIHEHTGLIVPPANPDRLAEAIIILLGDHTLREKMGNAGRQRIAAQFRIEQVVQQLEALYQNLVVSRKVY